MLRVVAVAVALVAVVGVALVRPPAVDSAAAPPTDDDPHMWRASSFLTPPQFRGSVTLTRPSSGKKNVRISWAYGDRFDVELEEEQVETLSFWPTAAEAVGPNALLVAGVEKTGDTRIELWEVPEPLVLLQAPAGQPPGAPPVAERLTPQPIADKVQLYDGQQAGKVTVTMMLKKRGTSSQAYVQFLDSRDLYVLDWSDPDNVSFQLEIAASSQPALTNNLYNAYSAGDHEDHGYVYVFGRSVQDFENTAAADFTPVDPFVLKDANRNGVFEPAEQVVVPWEDYSKPPWRLDDARRYVEADGILDPGALP